MRSLPLNQLLVLDALLAPGRELAASQIVAEVPSLSRSSTYAAITKLQADGRITARWDMPDSGQARRVFMITGVGRVAWNEARQRLGFAGGRLAPQAVQ